MKKRIVLALVLLAIVIMAAVTSRPFDTGYAWDFGGIDKDGIFLCPDDWNQFPYETNSPYEFLIPVWSILPIADC